ATGIVLALGRAALSAGRLLDAARGPYLAALAFAATLGWYNYYQFDGKVFSDINDFTDTAYYYTNSKYLAELDYDGLYAGALLCDSERGSPRTKHVRTFRDLRNDALYTLPQALEHGREVRKAFSDERWAGFCHDIEYFLDRLSKKALASNFFVDHGYNPPPTWTLVGGNLALVVDVEHLKWICHVDTALIALMLGVLWWGLGLETMLFASLFFTATFSGRWPILGMAITRFDWVVALVIGWVLLKKEQYAGAAAAMTYAALNRVFPAIFFWGWAVEAVTETWRTRKLARKHVVFAATAVVVGGLMVGAAAAEYGPSTLVSSAQQLKLHNQSFSSHRVGLATTIVWDGEITRDEINEHGGMRTKELRVQAMMPWLRGVAVLVLAAIAAYGFRTNRRAHDLVPLVMLAFFCATTPQVNYYNLRLVPLSWHASKLDQRRHVLLLSLLLAVEVAAQAAHVVKWDRFTVNAVSSVGLLVYFAALVGVMAWEAIGGVKAEESSPLA
ncbi:MAG: hypothetical protein KC621_11385, partial [Myxococcales bacterium]|nr:hypothetical protein [Myxococcales bacterium]